VIYVHNPQHSRKVVLTIAGFDPSSGAGITADLKTIAAHGHYGIAGITALTVQTTQSVLKLEPLKGDLLRETLEALVEDTPPSSVKIGMLANRELTLVVADFLRRFRLSNVVLDPVLRSSSGMALLDTAGLEILRGELLGLVDVVTPNLGEAEELSGISVRHLAGMKSAAVKLVQLGAKNVVITGGHLEEPSDVLLRGGDSEPRIFRGEKIFTSNTHGTGCTFSTALACRLAEGMELADAVFAAKQYVTDALRYSYSPGKGTGPVNHLFRMH
jgi:hydroxymethylpyrimidine/phosphomethylpyrimidine kinase